MGKQYQSGVSLEQQHTTNQKSRQPKSLKQTMNNLIMLKYAPSAPTNVLKFYYIEHFLNFRISFQFRLNDPIYDFIGFDRKAPEGGLTWAEVENETNQILPLIQNIIERTAITFLLFSPKRQKRENRFAQRGVKKVNFKLFSTQCTMN